MNGVPSHAVLTSAAVDFFLAATECRVISSVVSRVEHSTPVEVYWMRRANVGDEQMCVDTLTLSRRPLSLSADSEQPPTTDNSDGSKQLNTDIGQRSDSPYDNLLSTFDDAKPGYGFLAQPPSTGIHALHTEGYRTEINLPEPLLPTFSALPLQPSAAGQAVKSPVSGAATVFQRRSPEHPPPIYSAAKDMPSAQLQSISYGHYDDVDSLASILRNVDPRAMEDATQRQQIMSQLQAYSSTSSGLGTAKAEVPLLPTFVTQYTNTDTHATAADMGSVAGGWHCQQCTYYNDKSTLVCDICHSGKI